MSKVLKTVAKEDQEAFMKANDILPALQHGFRKRRLFSTALATAHAAWVSANKSKAVAVIGFDLSAAFDTVGREDLLRKMLAMGIGGKELKWFRCYLTDAKQRLVWDGQVSYIVDAEYGVKAGSLLGRVLYLLHVFDLPIDLEIRESDDDSAYADDKAIWVIAEDIKEVQRELQRLVDAMAKFTRDNGLALNGAKTQVMIGGAKAKARDITIHVDGADQYVQAVGGHIRPEVHGASVPQQPLQGGKVPGQPRCMAGTTPLTLTTALAAGEWSPLGLAGTLPPRRGAVEAAWVNETDPGGAGKHPGCHQRRGQVHRRLQEGGSYPRRGAARGCQVHFAQPAGGSGHSHGRMECPRERRWCSQHKEPGREPHVQQRQRGYGEANQGDGGRRGQGCHKRGEHPRDPRARDLERVREVEGLRVKGRGQ
jgi:hypothetical protein